MTYEFDNGINRVGPADDQFLPFLRMVLEKSAERDSARSCDGDAQREAGIEAVARGRGLTRAGA
jgi:hypothetical protein